MLQEVSSVAVIRFGTLTAAHTEYVADFSAQGPFYTPSKPFETYLLAAALCVSLLMLIMRSGIPRLPLKILISVAVLLLSFSSVCGFFMTWDEHESRAQINEDFLIFLCLCVTSAWLFAFGTKFARLNSRIKRLLQTLAYVLEAIGTWLLAVFFQMAIW